ncbi:MAG: PilZ domain-containing protein [Myxococcales bacterium]|nr:PilZ domain-containing protein [Myxococcales bacterium]
MSALHPVTATNRRAHLRVSLAARARLSFDGRAATVQMRDLSMGGLGSVEPPAFAPGSPVDVELELDGERVVAPGEIVPRDGGFGVRFTRLDQAALTRILDAVARASA